jgi:hypothetical protein
VCRTWARVIDQAIQPADDEAKSPVAGQPNMQDLELTAGFDQATRCLQIRI